MSLDHNEDLNFPLSKFESMLKTNNIYFFDAEDFESIIHYYLDNGKVALAKKAIKIGLEQHPASIELKLLHTEVLIFDDKLEIASQLLDELEDVEPYNEEIYIQKANIFSRKSEHQTAISTLQQALAITEDAAEIYALIGMEYLFLEDYKKAKTHFIKCLEIDNQDYAALYNIVYCFDFLEDHDGAIAFLNKFLDDNPYSEIGWHQLGRQYFIKEMYKEALNSLDFAIYSDDEFIGAYLEKGKVLEKLERYNEAIENYETTLKLDDPTSFAFLRIGKCHEKLGNLELAKKHYYKTVQEDPLLDKGWITITDFYYKQKNYQKALYYINKAIYIDSENVSYWKRCAEINEKLQLYEEANLAYQRTVDLGNYELETWISWANILVKLGEYEDAVQVLLEGLEYYPNHPKIEYRLAGLYFTLSKETQGNFYLLNALKTSFKEHTIIIELFPNIYNKKTVKNSITNFKNTS